MQSVKQLSYVFDMRMLVFTVYVASPLHSQSVYCNHHYCLLWSCFVTTAIEYLCQFSDFPLPPQPHHPPTHPTNTHTVRVQWIEWGNLPEAPSSWSCVYFAITSTVLACKDQSAGVVVATSGVFPPCVPTVATAGWISFHILSVVRSYQCVTHKPSPFLPWIKIWFHLLSTNV